MQSISDRLQTLRMKSLQTSTVMSEMRRRLAAAEEEDGSPGPSEGVGVKDRSRLRGGSREAELSDLGVCEQWRLR